jgi:hypothetical protein
MRRHQKVKKSLAIYFSTITKILSCCSNKILSKWGWGRGVKWGGGDVKVGWGV